MFCCHSNLHSLNTHNKDDKYDVGNLGLGLGHAQKCGGVELVNEIPTLLSCNNMAWVRAQLCKLQKRCTRLAAASDQVYQLLVHGQWFSPGTPASSTTKTGRHDIAEISAPFL
jgi:hypothetical protein